MSTPRRALLLVSLAAPAVARAQSRPLRFVVPYPPGGSADLMARALATHLAARSGRAAVVENRPGAAGAIGTAYVARAAPNGETILQGDIGALSIGLAAGRPGYAAEDFVPIARLTIDPVVLAARADGPFPDLAAVLARARVQPGAVSYATPGILSHLHLAMERFARLAGIELNHIPFQGTAAGVTAVLAGQVDLIAVPPTNVADPASRLRPLAVALEAPSPDLPGTPTFREHGIDLTLAGWRGLFAPRGTPPEVTAALERAVLDAFADPDFTAAFRRLGLTPAPLDAGAFAAFWSADRAAMEPLVAALPRG